MVRKPDGQVGIEQVLTDRRYAIQRADLAHARLACEP
jgi:hypothetical protein